MSRIYSKLIYFFVLIFIPSGLFAEVNVERFGFAIDPEQVGIIRFYEKNGSFIGVFRKAGTQVVTISEYDIKKATTKAFELLYEGPAQGHLWSLSPTMMFFDQKGYIYLFFSKTDNDEKTQVRVYDIEKGKMTTLGLIPGSANLGGGRGVYLGNSRFLFYGDDIVVPMDYKSIYYLDLNAAFEYGIGLKKVGELVRPGRALGQSFFNKNNNTFYILGSKVGTVTNPIISTSIDKCEIKLTGVVCSETGYSLPEESLLGDYTTPFAFNSKEERFYFYIYVDYMYGYLHSFSEADGYRLEGKIWPRIWHMTFSEKLGENGGFVTAFTDNLRESLMKITGK